MKKITQNGIFFNEAAKNDLQKFDSIIFDCDGVLIDVTKSYDLAIQQTTKYVLEKFADISKPLKITSRIIDGFKAKGGFNDEVDLTYAAIISLTAANKLNENPEEFIFSAIRHADQTGIKSVEQFLDTTNVDISDIRKKLDYPGTVHENPLYSLFDQFFYGPELYSKLFKKTSNFSGSALIDNDEVIVNQELLLKLKKRFSDKIAIVSGRGIESIRYSLQNLLKQFDLTNSAFLEDEPRELAKPNPKSLIRSVKGLKSKNCLYVGDSMEDLIMADKVTKLGNKVTFCGIIGTSKNPEQKRKLFEQSGATIILETIHQIPKVLNLE